MKPTIKLDQSVILTQHPEVIHLLVELTAPPAPIVARPPLDIAVVIDRSGSMNGQPIDAVRQAVVDLLRIAGAQDRIAVITFDTQVDLLLPLAHHDVTEVRSRVLDIQSGGSTNLSAGWLKGMEILTSAASDPSRQNPLSRIIVLTDGQANAGITDRDELCTMIRGATTHGITTSMIGFGEGYDEAFIAALADAGHGNDYWCAGPDQALNVFRAEFAGLASVVAQNLSVQVRPTEATKAFQVLNDFESVDVAGFPRARQVAIGDAFGDEVRRLIISFSLPPRTAVGTFNIADLVIRWASTLGSIALHEVIVPISLTATENASEIAELDPQVTEHVLKLKVAQLRQSAVHEARQMNYVGSRALFAEAINMLVLLGADPHEIRELVSHSENLEARDESSLKIQYSLSREPNKGRRVRFDKPNTIFPK